MSGLLIRGSGENNNIIFKEKVRNWASLLAGFDTMNSFISFCFPYKTGQPFRT